MNTLLHTLLGFLALSEVLARPAVRRESTPAAATPAKTNTTCQADPENVPYGCPMESVPLCNMTTTNCSLSALPDAPSIGIIPGNGTHCLNASHPYYFQVYPGNTSKLLIWFYGGGGCWSDDIDMMGSCAQSSSPSALPLSMWVADKPKIYTSGIFNRSRNDSIFTDFTILAIHYCSGDLHFGNVVRTYKNKTTGEVIATARQSGSNNTLSALNWVFENVQAPKELIISGCSAGSLGAQGWSSYIYGHYNTTLGEDAPRTAVIADGYAGVLSENQRSVFYGIKMHESPLAEPLSKDLKARFDKGEMLWCELVNEYQDSMADVAFVGTQSAYDAVQIGYFNLLASTANKTFKFDNNTPACAKNGAISTEPFLTPEAFYNNTLNLYNKFIATGESNFVPFLINSTQHCWLQYDNMYEVNVTDHATGKMVKLSDWLVNLPLGGSKNSENISTVCDDVLACPSPMRNNTIDWDDMDDDEKEEEE